MMRLLRRSGDLVSGVFRRLERPIWGESLCVVVLFFWWWWWWGPRGDSALVIGDDEILNSSDAPEIVRLSEPEGV